MIVYKEREKFKAELCKHLAYFLASLSGLMLIRMTIYGDHIIQFCNIRGFTALACLAMAYTLIQTSFAIYNDLDYKTAKNDDKIKTEEDNHG